MGSGRLIMSGLIARIFRSEQIAEADAARRALPGQAEYLEASALFEAAMHLHPDTQPVLAASDGTGASTLLMQAALRWTLRAHLRRHNQPIPDSVSAEWSAVTSQEHALISALPVATMESALAALTRPSTERRTRAELDALTQVTRALLAPLEAESSRQVVLAESRRRRVVASATVAALLLVAGGAAVKHALRPPNLATHARVTASSLFAPYTEPQHLVDGDMTKVGVCTQFEERPWILLDLGTPQTIHEIFIHNRFDCCTARAMPLSVQVGLDVNALKEVARKTDDFIRWTVTIPPTQARYVRLQTQAKNHLHLNEVEIR